MAMHVLKGIKPDLARDVLVVSGEDSSGQGMAFEIDVSAIGPMAMLLLQAGRLFPGQPAGSEKLAQPLSLDRVAPVLLEDGRAAFELTLEEAMPVVVAPSAEALATLARCLSGLDEEDEDVPPPLKN